MKALNPANEAERLAALKEYHILDTGGEQSYDDITALAAHEWCDLLYTGDAFLVVARGHL